MPSQMNSPTAEIYEFGPYRLDLLECRLWRGTEEVKLRPKVFDLLVFLVKHPRELIERNTLIAHLWPDSIVDDNGLTVAVNALRAELGDGYIETVPKRGYRFTCDVKLVTDSHRPDRMSGDGMLEFPGGALPLHSRFYVRR